MTCAALPPPQESPVTWEVPHRLGKENENHSFFHAHYYSISKSRIAPTITILGSFNGKQYCECFGRILDNYWVTLKKNCNLGSLC